MAIKPLFYIRILKAVCKFIVIYPYSLFLIVYFFSPKLKFCDIKGPDVMEVESPLTKGMLIMKRNSEPQRTFKPKLATKKTVAEDKKSALSLEEREAAYQLARARIFKNANTLEADSPTGQDNLAFERDTDSEASLQLRDDLAEDRDVYQRGRVMGFSQIKDETGPSQITPLSRTSYRTINASYQPESQQINYFDNDYSNQSYDNRQQYQADQSSSINTQNYSSNNYLNRRMEGQSTKSIAETAAPYQQFQIQFQPGYSAPPVNNSYQLESAKNYPTGQQYGTYNPSSDQYYSPYGNNNYISNNSGQAQYQFNPMGPTDISFRPPPVNRQLFDHTRSSSSKLTQPTNNNSTYDVNKLTQSLNSIRLNNDQTPAYNQYRPSPKQLQYTLQVLPKSGSEPLRNVFIKGAMIKRVQQRGGGYALLALFDSEESADLAMQNESNNPNNLFYLTRWEGESLTPGSYNGSVGSNSPGIMNNSRANENELTKNNSNNNQSRVQAI
jgi:hypothetical protein